jgi:hypothetical protein
MQFDTGELLGGDAELLGPARPAVDGFERGDKRSVVVEQEGFGTDLHGFDPTVPCGGGRIRPFGP